jgi:hypothetical protein
MVEQWLEVLGMMRELQSTSACTSNLNSLGQHLGYRQSVPKFTKLNIDQ